MKRLVKQDYSFATVISSPGQGDQPLCYINPDPEGLPRNLKIYLKLRPSQNATPFAFGVNFGLYGTEQFRWFETQSNLIASFPYDYLILFGDNMAPAGFTLQGVSAAEIVYPTIITVPYSPAGGFQLVTNWQSGTNVSQITINGTVSSVRETLEG